MKMAFEKMQIYTFEQYDVNGNCRQRIERIRKCDEMLLSVRSYWFQPLS